MSTIQDIQKEAELQDSAILSELQFDHLIDSESQKICLRAVNSATDLVKWLFGVSDGRWDLMYIETLPLLKRLVNECINICHRRDKRLHVLPLANLYYYKKFVKNFENACKSWSEEWKAPLQKWHSLLLLAKSLDFMDQELYVRIDSMDRVPRQDKGEWKDLKKHPIPPSPSSEKDEVPSNEVKEAEVIYVAGDQDVNDPVFQTFEQWTVREKENNEETPEKEEQRKSIMKKMITCDEKDYSY